MIGDYVATQFFFGLSRPLIADHQMSTLMNYDRRPNTFFADRKQRQVIVL